MSGRIPELDGVRGMAILLILIDHYIYGGLGAARETSWGAVLRDIFPLAWSGVDLFFVLSGFLIGGILIDNRNSDGCLKTFYIRRACRILPLYFVWISLFFVLARLLSGCAFSGWYGEELAPLPHLHAWKYFLFLQNFHFAKVNEFGPIWTGITWSLCVEEQFYLLMPLIILLTPPRKLPWVAGVLLLAGCACRISLYLHSSALTYVLLPCRSDGLLLGVLCACWVRHPGAIAWLQRRVDWLYLAFAILGAGVVALTVLARSLDVGAFTDWNSFEMNAVGYLCIDAFYACLLLLVLTAQTSLIARAMRFPLLRHFGVISYCMYLIHCVVLQSLDWWILAGPPKMMNWPVTLLAFFVTWGLAALSWKFFEKPIINWGHSFTYREPAKLALAPQA